MSTTTQQPLNLQDDRAFERAFRSLFPGLCAYAHRFVPDIDEAEEVVQQVFITLWEKRQDIQIRGTLKSYLFRAVHNRCLNQLRNQKVRLMHHEQHQATRPVSEFVDPAEQGDLRERLYEAIGRLPKERGRIFRMNRFDALTYREIAQKLGISQKTVESQMSKALRQLRGWLADVRVWWLIFFFMDR